MQKLFLFLILILVTTACKLQNRSQMNNKHPYTNLLIHESSPYLLQHAHNPVNWHPWGKEAFKKAQDENKLIIISIGYSACHWCHVMEHESFEDSLVANVMNRNYVSIKVDREEHPDVDKIYMSAVQLLTGRGGWPLNIVALPDGRPVWGGTYFRKENWKSALEQIAKMWHDEPDKLYEAANELEKGIKAGEIIVNNDEPLDLNKGIISTALNFWKKHGDPIFGGFKRAPKFPMPSQYKFLMRAAVQLNDNEIGDLVRLTLNKMQQGGIYDHINGGFFRYSVDVKWHIPHFEKMLYDNGQLVSLYSEAYLVYKKDSYKKTVEETLAFVKNELMDEKGAFYSSLDADSLNDQGELEEGSYYIFSKQELKNAIGEDFDLFKKYFNINEYGLWEKGQYHLIKKNEDEVFASNNHISIDTLKNKLIRWKQSLSEIRSKRNRPRLDDKSITSWNAIMLNGFIDAYKSLGEKKHLLTAIKNARFIKKHQFKEDGGLWRIYKNGKSNINGYLEDYAWVIKSYINLYEVTSDEQWLKSARLLAEYVKDNFMDHNTGMFYFVDKHSSDLVVRPVETQDNVIPSSNAIMAENLFKLGHYFENENETYQAAKMLHNVLPKIDKYPPGYYYWLNHLLDHVGSYYEIAITGPMAAETVRSLNRKYIPNKIIAWSEKENSLPLLKGRFVEGKTLIYLCMDNTCQLPEEDIKIVLKKIKITL
jgi:uncharacterized protein YyaL (SSP411 family)